MGGLEPLPNPSDDRRTVILVNVFTATSLAAIVTILRLLTRFSIVRKVGWDDYSIVLATLGHVVGMSLVLCELHYGFGRHTQFLSETSYFEYSKFSYGEWIQTFQTLMFNKLSVCFFLLRLPVGKHYIRPLQGAIVALIVSNVILTFVWIFQCSPVKAAYNKGVPAQCMTNAQLQRIIISQALISIISDVLLALFPIVILWKVQISLRTKVGLCSLMGLGLMCVSSFPSLLRTVAVFQLTHTPSTAGLSTVRAVLNWENVNADETWESVPNWAFRSWEVSVGIIAACIPALRPGYRVVSSYVSTYYSLHYGSGVSTKPSRDQRKTSDESDDTLVGRPSAQAERRTRDLEEKPQLAQELTYPSQAVPYDSAAHGATHVASVQADRSTAIGEGVEDFPMSSIRGDLGKTEQGIKKTTWFGTDSEPEESQIRSFGSGDLERGQSGRGFI